MPNMKNAKKKISVNAKKTVANNTIKSSMRTAVKNTHKALNSETMDNAQYLAIATKRINKAVSKGTIHKNTAARMKSKLAKKVNQAAA